MFILLWWSRLMPCFHSSASSCYAIRGSLVVMQSGVVSSANCWTCWESSWPRSNPRRLKLLWLLLHQEWRFPRPLFHWGLGTTAMMSMLLIWKSIRGSFSDWKISDTYSWSKPTLTWGAWKWMMQMANHCFQFMLF